MLVVLIAAGTALAWLAGYVGCVLLTRTGPPGGRPVPGQLPDAPPALVNLVVTGARLDGAAYPATILGLAAQGQLVITESGPGTLCCALPPAAPAGARLAPFEQQVLTEAQGRLAGRAAVPFQVLADAVAVDSSRLWHPFETAVRAAGRRAGLTQPRFPRRMESALLGGAVLVGLLACLAVFSRPGHGLAGPLSTGAFGAFLPACCVWGIAGQDRLTRAGADLAAQAATVGAATSANTVSASPVSPAVLRQLAVAVAGHVPVPLAGAGPGAHIGVRLGGARSPAAVAGKPTAGWSSMTGEWRLVPIRPPGLPRYRHPFRLLGLAGAAALVLAWIGWLGPAGRLTDPSHLVSLTLVLLLAAAGLAALAGYLARPARAMFLAQVIACWTEDRGKQETVLVYCYAVDDGRQTWCGEASEADFARLRAGDMIRVRAAPRNRRLTGLDFTQP